MTFINGLLYPAFDLIIPLGNVIAREAPPLLEVAGRVALIYLSVILMFRVVGHRALGQLSPFDFITVLLLSSALQNGMMGENNTLAGGITGALTLLLLNHLITHVGWLHRLLIKQRVILVDSGEVDHIAMRENGITMEHLWSSIREAGISELKEVKEATLEISGRITVINRAESMDDKDPLTGLPQYWKVSQTIDQMRRQHGRVFAMLVDIEGMTRINAIYSYDAGNAVLRKTALQILANVQPGDEVFRYSGDCFLILSPLDEQAAAAFSGRMVEKLQGHSISFEGREIPVKTNVSAMSVLPTIKMEDLELQLRNAMKQVKTGQEVSQCGW